MVKLNLSLPSEIEDKRAYYHNLIGSSLNYVISWFKNIGFAVTLDEIITNAAVFNDNDFLRNKMAEVFGIPLNQIIKTFCGTVHNKTLYILSIKKYEAIYKTLYPDYQWNTDCYKKLIIHELAHKAHALTAIHLKGTEDGMGPRWFFEGLAMLCANQFISVSNRKMTINEIERYAREDQNELLSYPIYASMVRSLAISIPLNDLIKTADSPNFLDFIKEHYL
ncbi:hypothetical protein KAW65_02705 [candidate division WOR-3 bacterium]|nr:hypothetical protein [candidate division WOR-3 bacterium]